MVRFTDFVRVDKIVRTEEKMGSVDISCAGTWGTRKSATRFVGGESGRSGEGTSGRAEKNVMQV